MWPGHTTESTLIPYLIQQSPPPLERGSLCVLIRSSLLVCNSPPICALSCLKVDVAIGNELLGLAGEHHLRLRAS